ncbi:MAG: FecR family protein [Elusimicrobiota bacterium]|nr:MAG: FecR family protein [Elusimicrobiota bacterium]
MKLAFALLAALAASAAAQDATLAKISGPVSIVGAGGRKAVAAKGGESLIYGDTIKVGKGGIAQIALKDRGAVLLREETVMTLTGTPRATALSFRFGEFLIGLSKKLEKGQTFKVRTASAVAAVRGTLFWGKGDKETKATTYAGFGHTVAVTAKGRTVLVTPGKTVTIPFGEAPADPVPSTVTIDYAKNFAIDGGLQSLEKLVTDKTE